MPQFNVTICRIGSNVADVSGSWTRQAGKDDATCIFLERWSSSPMLRDLLLRELMPVRTTSKFTCGKFAVCAPQQAAGY